MLDNFRKALSADSQISTRTIDRYALAQDASHFSLLPCAVMTAKNAEDVAALMKVSAREGIPLTFRSGGTSLSGQAVGEGILVDVRKHFRSIEVLDSQGLRVKVRPGSTIRSINSVLRRYGRQLGPDPASERACTIGGVIANNSSGMNCGIANNAYKTLESMKIVLPSGTIIDTSEPDSNSKLASCEPEIHDGLARLRDRVISNPAMVRKIQQQYSLKNTMGYGLNSLVDFHNPAEILSHLIIGSEGTLGFVAEAVFRTIPLPTHATTGLLVFPDLHAANEALPEIVASQASTVELLDARSLRVAQKTKNVPNAIADLRVHNHAALLVEYSATCPESIEELMSGGTRILANFSLAQPAAYSTESDIRNALWTARKGLYAAVAGSRPRGTTALLEDIAVPLHKLGHTCSKLVDLFDKHHFSKSVIFGHAKDGNIHFMLTDDFSSSSGLGKYRDFTEDMVDLVLGQGGTLKAEHGTGRVMSPFVKRQFGDELYSVMRQIKDLCDPDNILNPDVIFSDDPEAHLNHIKSVPAVSEEVDRCVSCGYCEPVCPSKDLTLTPRQRIEILRAMESARRSGDINLVTKLEKDYKYEVIQTCAVDGMCQVYCPVEINTGEIVKSLRQAETSQLAQVGSNVAAQHWNIALRVVSAGLTLAQKSPAAIPIGITSVARKALGNDCVPLYSPDLPSGGQARGKQGIVRDAIAVYFPSCTSEIFGASVPNSFPDGIQKSIFSLAKKAGLKITLPGEVEQLCCGTPWASKGLELGKGTMYSKTRTALQAATKNWSIPILSDASSCTEGLQQMLKEDRQSDEPHTPKIVDIVEFAVKYLLPHLKVEKKISTLVIHPTCSSTRLSLNGDLMKLARSLAVDVQIPDDWSCCAFAGDRGMLHPELTESATLDQSRQVKVIPAASHASCNRTCEIGMSRATGENYRHIVELLDEMTSS